MRRGDEGLRRVEEVVKGEVGEEGGVHQYSCRLCVCVWVGVVCEYIITRQHIGCVLYVETSVSHQNHSASPPPTV